MNSSTTDNPLGYKKESTLLINFAIPCIISMLVTALYNIVDQIFIGQGIGMLGKSNGGRFERGRNQLHALLSHFC